MCERIERNDGRGARKEGAVCLEVYMPRPTLRSGFDEGSRAVIESCDGTSVRDESEVEDRHLNDISENAGRSMEDLYGSMKGSSVGSLTTPKRWHVNGC